MAGPTQVIAGPDRSDRGATEHTGRPKPRGNRRTAIAVTAVVAAALVGLAVVVGVRLVGEDANQSGSNATSPSAVQPTDRTSAPSKPAIKLSSRLTDQSGVLGPLETDAVNRALNQLYNQRGTRLWVVYVKNFGGIKPFRWAEDTMRANGFADNDAILAIATDEPAFSFRVPNAVTRQCAHRCRDDSPGPDRPGRFSPRMDPRSDRRSRRAECRPQLALWL